jgi:hypothetical protein
MCNTTLLRLCLLLADAGADYSSFIDPSTGYNTIQTAANAGQFEAVVKLVEAGASWRLAKGQQRTSADGKALLYVPEIMRCRSKPKQLVSCYGPNPMFHRAELKREPGGLTTQGDA